MTAASPRRGDKELTEEELTAAKRLLFEERARPVEDFSAEELRVVFCFVWRKRSHTEFARRLGIDPGNFWKWMHARDNRCTETCQATRWMRHFLRVLREKGEDVAVADFPAAAEPRCPPPTDAQISDAESNFARRDFSVDRFSPQQLAHVFWRRWIVEQSKLLRDWAQTFARNVKLIDLLDWYVAAMDNRDIPAACSNVTEAMRQYVGGLRSGTAAVPPKEAAQAARTSASQQRRSSTRGISRSATSPQSTKPPAAADLQHSAPPAVYPSVLRSGFGAPQAALKPPTRQPSVSDITQQLASIRIGDSLLVQNVKLRDSAKPLGKGNFGEVLRGSWRGVPVAIKCISSPDINEFLSEASVLKELRHPNVLQFFGITELSVGSFGTQGLFMVMELAEGSVLDLIRSKELDKKTLVSIACDCAAGMEYLSSHNIVHRDLAARNLLFFKKGVGITAKVSDFGLARQMHVAAAGKAKAVYTQTSESTPLPFKWTAPEALRDREFTVMSDVWSFGIVLWELFSRGAEPFGLQRPQTIDEVLAMLDDGGHLDPPVGCDPEIAQIMQSCWDPDPILRPSFEMLFGLLRSNLPLAPAPSPSS